MADPEGNAPRQPTCCQLFWNFIKIYWMAIFSFVWPTILLPIFLLNNTPAMRCLYIVVVMAGLWITEALPLPITALIPMVAFPVMGILDSDKTSWCYMKETNMMFIGGIVIAIAVEHCNLHQRLALGVMKCVGCSPKRLHLGLCGCTCFVSMWISNTAATAMMLPIVEATLGELEDQKIIKLYENRDDPKDPQFDMTTAKPTKVTIGNYMSIAFAAAIGGIGTIVGTGTNLTFKGIYEARFPDSTDQISFTTWLVVGIPIMLVSIVPTVIFMQVMYLGLFRPNSKDAKDIAMGKEGQQVASDLIRRKLTDLGPMSFHEKGVTFFFVLAVVLWFFRNPQFMPGWAEAITKTKVKDATPAIFVCVMMYFFPAKPDFMYAFSKDGEKRPKTHSEALLTWKIVQQKMHWGFVFLLGGGFALAEGSKESGMSELIGDKLAALSVYPKLAVLIMIILVVCFITQIFSSNVAVANIVLPVIAEMSVASKWHPLYLMMPAGFACSYGYCLPISTPPNALVAIPINMPTSEMIKSGAVVTLICAFITYAMFIALGPVVFNLDVFPDWANPNASTTSTTTPRS